MLLLRGKRALLLDVWRTSHPALCCGVLACSTREELFSPSQTASTHLPQAARPTARAGHTAGLIIRPAHSPAATALTQASASRGGLRGRPPAGALASAAQLLITPLPLSPEPRPA